MTDRPMLDDKVMPVELAWELWSYDENTGQLHWRRSPYAVERGLVGKRADRSIDRSYRVVRHLGRFFKAHRIAWLMHYGSWPTYQIDHINGDPSDNRVANLREATNQENAQNLHRAHVDSRSGLLGVTPAPTGGYWARIQHNGVLRHLGTFDKPEEAHAVYLEAKRALHGHCVI